MALAWTASTNLGKALPCLACTDMITTADQLNINWLNPLQGRQLRTPQQLLATLVDVRARRCTLLSLSASMTVA